MSSLAGDLVSDAIQKQFAQAIQGFVSGVERSAGAAGGIAGGYRLPFTAVMMVLGLGGPFSATVTCLATVGVATIAGVGAAFALDRLFNAREEDRR